MIGPRCTHGNVFSQRILIRQRIFSIRKVLACNSQTSKFEDYIHYLSIYCRDLNTLFRCFVGGVTPVLIPNTEVKSSRTDGTAHAGE